MHFLLINKQLLFPETHSTTLLRRFKCTQEWDYCYFHADHKVQQGIIQGWQRYN